MRHPNEKGWATQIKREETNQTTVVPRCTHRSTMQRGKEISEDIRKKVLTAHQSGESYKTISKRFQLHPSTVRQIILKWRAFNMMRTSLAASGVNVHVHVSTIYNDMKGLNS